MSTGITIVTRIQLHEMAREGLCKITEASHPLLRLTTTDLRTLKIGFLVLAKQILYSPPKKCKTRNSHDVYNRCDTAKTSQHDEENVQFKIKILIINSSYSPEAESCQLFFSIKTNFRISNVCFYMCQFRFAAVSDMGYTSVWDRNDLVQKSLENGYRGPQKSTYCGSN